jgi:mannose-6-phosphate isomerase-like protein (cupin superfamily)
MHAHPADEAVWLVLDGEATFYGQGEDGQGERVVARLGRHEMLLIPRGTPYWFESSSETPLVILRFAAKDLAIGTKRIDYGERRAKPKEVVAGSFFGQ